MLENALAQYPDDLHIQINLANALAQCGELAAAIDMHARVLARQPDDVHTLVNLASLEIRRYDYAQAQTYLDQALALALQHSGALSAGRRLALQHHFEPAIARCARWASASRRWLHHPRRLARPCRCWPPRRRLAAYQRALDIEPADADTHSNLCWRCNTARATPLSRYLPGIAALASARAPLPCCATFRTAASPSAGCAWVGCPATSTPIRWPTILFCCCGRRWTVQFESFAYDTSFLTADSVTERLQAIR